jgi:hypothetical protein
MYSRLCDRCLACAHEILVKYDFKTEFENKTEAIKYIKALLDCINSLYKPLDIHYEMGTLHYDFLNKECEDCENIKCMTSKKAVTMFLKIYVINKIFDCVTECKFKNEWLKDEHFLTTVRNKIITFHLSLENNKEAIYYYHQNMINYKDLAYIPNFEEMNKLPFYYEKIFEVPIYLANELKESYLFKKGLNLEEKIKQHKLCLKNESL